MPTWRTRAAQGTSAICFSIRDKLDYGGHCADVMYLGRTLMRHTNTGLRDLQAPRLHVDQYGVHRSLLCTKQGMSQNAHSLAMLSTQTFIVAV